MFYSDWLSLTIHAWPLWLTLIGLLILVIYRMARHKDLLERPDAWGQEATEEHQALIDSAWSAWRRAQRHTPPKT